MRGEPGAGDPQRQRQRVAQVHQLDGGVEFRPHPLPADDAGQQFEGVGDVERREVDAPDAGHARQPGPARGDHRAGRASRQERRHLLRAGHSVQDHEHAAVRQPAAVHLGALLDIVGNGLGRYPQRAEEPRQQGRDLFVAGRGVQVGVEVAVGEVPVHLVGGAYRQRRLPHASGAGDAHDRNGVTRVSRPGGRHQQVLDLVQVVPSSGEVADARRKLTGHQAERTVVRIRGTGPGRGERGNVPALEGGAKIERRRLLQNRLFQVAELLPRLDAHLLDEGPARPLERLQRLDLPPRAVQRQHEQLVQALPQGVPADQRRQFGTDLFVSGEHEVQADPLLENGQPPVVEMRGRTLGGVAGYAVQGGAAPELQGRAQGCRGLLDPAGPRVLPRRGGQPVELQAVHAAGVQFERVAGGPGGDGVGPAGLGELLAERRDGDLDLAARGGGGPVAPHRVDQLFRGGGSVDVQPQHRQDHPLTWATDVE